jgi:spore coat protein A, manganese oxidase
VQTRRELLKKSAMIGAGLATYGIWRPRAAQAFYQTPNLIPLFKQPLRGAAQIPIAVSDRVGTAGATHYSLDISQFTDQIIPPGYGFGPTTFWGYNPVNPGGTPTQKHLGGIIIAQKGQPIELTFTNKLTDANGNDLPHIIPVDTSISGSEAGVPQNRTAVHLHGGLVPWNSDGGPFAWFGPKGTFGQSFKNPVLDPLTGKAVPGQASYFYPMNQSARFLWYHDHAMGITRINAYAGIASGLLLRDSFEAAMIGAPVAGSSQPKGLPDYIENGGFELPIIVQDKIFVGADIGTADPTWTGSKAAGSLWYAHQYDTARYGPLGPIAAGSTPPPPISVIPEFFGDTMLANGTVFPQVTVQARRYRLRILNACNARFLNLQLYVDDGTPNGITLGSGDNPVNKPAQNAATGSPTGKPKPGWLVLGTEAGFLPNPTVVPSNVPFNGTTAGGSLLLAPAERADVIFDFSAHAAQSIILYTDTPAPFPMGSPLNDYFPGLNNKNPVNALTLPGFGPNTREILRFNVVPPDPAVAPDPPLTITTATNLTAGNDPLLAPLGVTTLPAGVPVRQLTLNEAFDAHGRLIQYLGTGVALPGQVGFGRPYETLETETVRNGDTEVWQIVNLTADTHPIHFHLVNVQILSRQALSGKYTGGIPKVSGAPVPPGLFENGWKETVRMNPGEVTNVIMKFALPAVPAGVVVPDSPRFPGKHEYVWHCHILEHEEHDMMRPLVVTP